MGRIDNKLRELGLSLPAPFTAPAGAEFKFDLVRVSDSVAYVSGHGPMDGSTVLTSGKVGDPVTTEQGAEAAGAALLSMLASLEQQLGDLDRVTGWVKLLGFVNAAPGFNAMPAVVNGTSDLILRLWGEAGRHARSAIGVSELPFDWPVEVEAVVEIST